MCHAPFLFIVPAQPILRPRPPHGDDYTRRFRSIASAMAPIPARSCIIDGELTACDAHGLPDFYALHFRRSDHLCV